MNEQRRAYKILMLGLIQALFLVGFVQAQDYSIYKQQGTFHVMPVKDTIAAHSSASASDALQFAIDQIQSGGAINLGKGIFELDRPIRFKNNITLNGKRRATELSIKKPNDYGLLLENVENVQISNLTITAGDNGNAHAAIFMKNTIYSTVQDVFILGFEWYALQITGMATGLEINRTTFVDNAQAHIFIEETSNTTGAIGSIKNSTIVRGGYGIKTVHHKHKGIPLQISGNMFFYTKGPAVDIDSHNLSLVGNRSYWVESDVFRIKGDHFTITGNSASWNRGHSLVFDSAKNGLVSGNNWTDQGVRSRDGYQKSGIVLYGSENITITGCSIWNFGDQGFMEYAVYEHPDCSNNSLVGNTAWFSKHKNAYRMLGKNTLEADNTVNKGVHRGDYWDFTKKYGPTVDKYLADLYLTKSSDIKISPDKNPEMVKGVKAIECKDMLEQVLTNETGTVKKFGWTGDDSQKWDIQPQGDSFLIINTATGKLLQATGTHDFTTVITAERNEQSNQLWKLINIGNGYYKIINKANGKALQAQGLNNYHWDRNNVYYLGQPITLGDYDQKEYQKWRFVDPMPAYVYSENIDTEEK